jgi:hypothetical protein
MKILIMNHKEKLRFIKGKMETITIMITSMSMSTIMRTRMIMRVI